MRLYTTPVNNDELMTDMGYKSEEKPDAGAIAFEGKWEERPSDPDDPSSEKVSVLDVVANFNLQKYEMKKAAFMGWAKQFMPMRKKQLEQSNPGKVEEFMTKAKKYVAYIVQHFDEFEFFMGRSCDPDDYLFPCIQEGDRTLFYLLELAVNSEKC